MWKVVLVLFCAGLLFNSSNSTVTAQELNNEIHPVTHRVEIKNMKFNPAVVYANPGDTVLFINNGIVAHDITEKNKAWTSSILPIKKSWSMKVTKSFDYYCSIHVVMTGKVVVK